MALLVRHEDREYVVEAGGELRTDLGVLAIPPDATPGDTLETHLGEKFSVRGLRAPDCFEHFERTGAPMLPRDIGLVMGETGASTGDRVLDVGTGTGVLAAYLAMAGATVLTYERDAEAAMVARENFAMAGVAERIEVREGDARRAIEDEQVAPVDVITLDTGDAPALAARADNLLVSGGCLAAYSPFVETTREIVKAAREELADVRAFDTIQRTLDIDDRGTRPSTRPVGHTGYLIVGRKA